MANPACNYSTADMEKVESFGPYVVLEIAMGGKGWYCLDHRRTDTQSKLRIEEAVRPFYGVPGDLLYIKEGVIIHGSIPQLVGYYMDGCRVTESWETRRTAMFMPKWAARTWLKLTDVRVERVQEISEADCIAEGCPKEYLLGVNWYRYLWGKINGKKHPWSSNPWVWVL